MIAKTTKRTKEDFQERTVAVGALGLFLVHEMV